MRRENLWGNSVHWYCIITQVQQWQGDLKEAVQVCLRMNQTRRIKDLKILYKPEPQQQSPHLPRLWGTRTLLLKRQKKNANIMRTRLIVLDLDLLQLSRCCRAALQQINPSAQVRQQVQYVAAKTSWWHNSSMNLFQYFVAATNQYKYTCIHTVNGKALNTWSYQYLQEKVASSEACLAFPPNSQSVPTKKILHVPVFKTMNKICLAVVQFLFFSATSLYPIN